VGKGLHWRVAARSKCLQKYVKTNKLWDLKKGITQKMKNENINREIHRFYYIKDNNVFRGKKKFKGYF